MKVKIQILCETCITKLNFLLKLQRCIDPESISRVLGTTPAPTDPFNTTRSNVSTTASTVVKTRKPTKFIIITNTTKENQNGTMTATATTQTPTATTQTPTTISMKKTIEKPSTTSTVPIAVTTPNNSNSINNKQPFPEKTDNRWLPYTLLIIPILLIVIVILIYHKKYKKVPNEGIVHVFLISIIQAKSLIPASSLAFLNIRF